MSSDLVLDHDDISLVQELLDGLKQISIDNIKAILTTVNADSEEADPDVLRHRLAASVLHAGVSRALSFLPKPLLRSLSDAAVKAEHDAHTQPQQQFAKAEIERAMGSALRRFLHERLDVSSLRSLCVALGVESLSRESAREASQREMQIADEVMLMGTETVLQALAPALLKGVAKELRIDAAANSSREGLVDAIMASIFNLEPLDKKKLERKQRAREELEVKREHPRKVKRGKSRYKAPPLSNIKKGITKQELHDLYNFTDLQEYCKENDLDYTGKKALLMRRIIAFLETGDKGVVKVPKKRKLH